MANKNWKKKINANKAKVKDFSQGNSFGIAKITTTIVNKMINDCRNGAIKDKKLLKVYNDYVKRGKNKLKLVLW